MPLFIAIVLTVLLLPTLAKAEVSADGVWRDVDERGVAATSTRAITPKHYRLLSLDRTALKRLLATAPLEDTGALGILVVLPLPEGESAQFSVVESPIMALELAMKFPELKTYLGTGIDDPTASLRFSVTPQGLHAQILSVSGRCTLILIRVVTTATTSVMPAKITNELLTPNLPRAISATSPNHNPLWGNPS